MSDAASDRAVWIEYRNWRGEVGTRCVVPSRVWFGATSWHPESQWLLDAYDVDKECERSFAMRDILSFCAGEDSTMRLADVPH